MWAWGLPSSTPTSSHVPDWAVICDGLVQPWLAAYLPGGRGKVGIGRDEPWPGLHSAGTCLFAEPRVSGVPHTSLLSHKHVVLLSETPVFVSPPPAPHAVRSSAGTYEAEEGLGCGTCRAPPLPHHDWGPSTDLSPERAPSGQTPVCFSLPQPRVLSQGQWLTCQLLHHPLSPLPKDLPPFLSAKPLI